MAIGARHRIDRRALTLVMDKNRPDQIAGRQRVLGNELTRPRLAAVAPEARSRIGRQRRQKGLAHDAVIPSRHGRARSKIRPRATHSCSRICGAMTNFATSASRPSRSPRRVVSRCPRPYLASSTPVSRGNNRIVSQSFLPPLPPYPTSRLRRNRREAWSRKLVAENALSAGDLIWPVFVHDKGKRAPVDTMPGAYRHSIASLVDAAGEAAALGIPTIAVFPAVDPALKDADGGEAVNP